MTGSHGISKITVKYFIKLFTASNKGDDERLFGLVQKRVTSEMNVELLKPFTLADISNAVRSMAPLKVLGLVGFLDLFFQRYWHVLGPQISKGFSSWEGIFLTMFSLCMKSFTL